MEHTGDVGGQLGLFELGPDPDDDLCVGCRVRACAPSGARTESNSRRSSTVRAIGPTWSSEGAKGKTPVVSMRPNVGLRPMTPQKAAGIRMDPAVSVPMAKGARPAASAAAEPPLEPPGTTVGSHGLRVGPTALPSVVIPHANSCVALLATTMPPAARIRSTTAASRGGTCPENILEP